MLAAKAIVIGTVTFIAGLAVAISADLIGARIMLANHVPMLPVTGFTELRLVVGSAALLEVSAVLALAVGILFRRAVPAILITLAMIVMPYIFASAPLFSLEASQWLLRLTPAVGFAI